MVQTSGIPEAETFGRNQKFSAFGLRFQPPILVAEYGRNFLMIVFQFNITKGTYHLLKLFILLLKSTAIIFWANFVKYPLLDLVINTSLLHCQCSAPNSYSYPINIWIVWYFFQKRRFEFISDVQWWKKNSTHISDCTHQ